MRHHYRLDEYRNRTGKAHTDELDYLSPEARRISGKTIGGLLLEVRGFGLIPETHRDNTAKLRCQG